MSLRNQSGSFLIAFIFSLSIAVMSAAFYYNNQFFIQKISYSKLLYLKSFESLHDSVVNVLFSQAAFVKTVTSVSNAGLERCLRDSNYSCPVGTYPLNLFIDDSPAATPWLPMATGNGLGLGLENCTSFPSMQCPFRYDLKWTSECDLNQAACPLPGIVVTGELSIHPQLPLKTFFNTDRIKLTMRLR